MFSILFNEHEIVNSLFFEDFAMDQVGKQIDLLPVN